RPGPDRGRACRRASGGETDDDGDSALRRSPADGAPARLPTAGMRSKPHLHPVIADLPAGFLGETTFPRTLEQHRVRVVDMNEDPAAYPEVAKRRDRAVLAAHADMAHAPAGLIPHAEPDHLVILPQCPIEEHQFGPGEPIAQTFGHCRAAG